MPHTGNTMSPLLWKPESWLSRLEELEARAGELKEAPLRRDVRSLGMLLGEVLREQAGERLFHLEEDLRQLSIERREADAIADDFYRDFQHEEPKQAAMLGSLSVQVHDDGWHYRWACKTSKDSGLGVFVGRNGQADYDEAPSCAGHELH